METDNFCVQRLWLSAGEGDEQVDAETHTISMVDGRSSYIAWNTHDGKQTKRTRVLANDLFIWPAQHTWWVRRESAKGCIRMRFSTHWLQQTTDDANAQLRLQTQVRDPLVTLMLRALATIDAPYSAHVQLYRESLAATLALHVVTRYGNSPDGTMPGAALSRARLLTVTDYIYEHLGEPLTLTQLAQLAGLGTSQFARRFQAATGETPHRFVLARRIERAKDLLRAGKHAPAEVALLTGFADQSHLTRHMRRALGVTPRDLMPRRAP